MTNRFVMSVAAAALIAGTGFANAQGTGTSRDAPSSGATTQQSAPPSAAPMNRDASQSGAPAEAPKSAQSKDMERDGGKNMRAQDNNKAGAKGEKSAQDNNMKGEKSKSMSSETNEKGAAGGNMNRAEERNGAAKSTTTGQAGAAAKLSTEQRTKITSVFKSQHVQPATNVNFSISVGTRVPRNVGFHPLPAEIVTIYPEWRGYEFFVVNNQIIVVNPRTLEIVDVIDV
ncbi:MAG: hypothetical protein QOD09_3519 [Bradyrhizobium sp.]|jgi:hypothetical protein|nr:hypothetical protein [Bradyrhizobium sp.]